MHRLVMMPPRQDQAYEQLVQLTNEQVVTILVSIYLSSFLPARRCYSCNPDDSFIFACAHASYASTHYHVDVKTTMNNILSLCKTDMYKQLSQLTRGNVDIQSSKTPRELTPASSLSASRSTRQSHCYHNPKIT